MSEKEKIISQTVNPYSTLSRYSDIKKLNSIGVDKNRRMGKKIPKISPENYSLIYSRIINESDYFIMFNDESVVTIYYEFDENDNITKHHLSFLPSVNEEIDLSQSLNTDELYLVLKDCSYYFRADYEPELFQEVVHSNSHFHFGLHTQNENRKEFRLPIKTKIYPFDFVYIILKHIYEADDSELNSLLTKDCEKRCLLNEKELNSVFASLRSL